MTDAPRADWMSDAEAAAVAAAARKLLAAAQPMRDARAFEDEAAGFTGFLVERARAARE